MWKFANLVLDTCEWIFKHFVIALPWIILGLAVSVWFASKINGG